MCTKTQSTRAHCSSCEHQAYTSRYIHIYTRNPPICAKNDVAHNAHNGNDFLFVRTFAPLSWSFWPHMRACTKNRVSRIGWFVPLVFFRKKKNTYHYTRMHIELDHALLTLSLPSFARPIIIRVRCTLHASLHANAIENAPHSIRRA